MQSPADVNDPTMSGKNVHNRASSRSLAKDERNVARQSEADDTVLSPEPSSGLPQEMAAGAAYKRIFRYGSRTDHLLQIVASVAAIASGIGISMQTLIFGKFITTMNRFGAGQATPADFRRDASRLALYFVYLGVCRLALSYVYNFLFTYAAHRTIRNIRREFFLAALRQEVAFYDGGHAGSIATQASTNGQLIQGGISEKLGLALQGLAAFFAAFVVSLVVQWKLTLICLCIAPAALIILGIASNMHASLMVRSIGVYMRANSFVESVLGGVRLVHAFEMRHKLVQKLGDHLLESQKIGRKASPILGVMFSSQFTLVQLGFGLAIWRGIHMLASGEIQESGQIFTVILAVILACVNLTSLGPHFVDFSQAASAAAKLWVVIDRSSDIDPFLETGLRPSEINGTLELKNIGFAYPTRPNINVLNDFSLVIPAGKVTALVGPSGSGKSTIIGLLERWYNPLSGSIKIDNQTLDRYNVNWLRTSMRLVQQEPVLFRGTVFDNIRHGLCGTKWEGATEQEQLERIQEAAKIAFAHDFIIDLPNGYDTEVGQRGGLLSGGQKQRIAIARTVVSNPRILLLDEATSALDPHAEQVVQQALDQAAKGRTTVVIAHKLATIRNADNIVVLDKGKIVEQGTHESLIINNGTYAQLVKIQDLTATSEPDENSSIDTQQQQQQQGNLDDTTHDHELRKSLTRNSAAVQARTTGESDRYDYDLHRQLGFLAVIFRLVKENRGVSWSYMLVFLSILGGAATYPAQAILISQIVPVFNLSEPQLTDRGNFFSSMFVVLAAACLVSYFTLGYTTNTIAQGLNRKYREQIFHDILRQDLEFFDRPENSTGALTSKADSNPLSILELMGFNIALIGVSVVSLVASTILALAYSWKLGLVVILAGLPSMLGVGLLKVRSDAKLHGENSKRYSSSAAVASEAVTAIRTVSSLAIEKTFLQRYRTELNHAVADSKAPMCKLMVWFALMQAMEYWFMALGLWYGCRLLSLNEVEQSAFLIAFLGVFFAGQASAQLFQFSTSITKGLNAANYIFWLHGLQPAIQPTPENDTKGPDNGNHLVMDDMHFSYPLRQETPVLKGISITARKGQFIALVGASGCGKSTIVSLLERFYDVVSGSINIDGSALTSLNPQLYRRIVALVPQEPILFDGTVRDNIAVGVDATDGEHTWSPTKALTPIPDADIEAALRSANAWDFVSSLPEGVNTQVGTTGSQFSGGQRQRIAIARALIRNPKVLLLDEATSALDTESEKIVQNALDEASRSGDRITFAVAHRLSTIKSADMICVFYRGRIVEAGTHTSLISQGGMYKKMCEAQSLS